MHLSPDIRLLPEKKLAGLHVRMSLVQNRTGELWGRFMPRRRELQTAGDDLYSLQVYGPGYFEQFDPSNEFEKWALAEVANHQTIPADMEPFTLPGGLYAVFHYRGSNQDTRVFQYIYAEWLPASGYLLDERPHFEVLGEKYKNNDPDSEEDIYIPIQEKP